MPCLPTIAPRSAPLPPNPTQPRSAKMRGGNRRGAALLAWRKRRALCLARRHGGCSLHGCLRQQQQQQQQWRRRWRRRRQRQRRRRQRHQHQHQHRYYCQHGRQDARHEATLATGCSLRWRASAAVLLHRGGVSCALLGGAAPRLRLGRVRSFGCFHTRRRRSLPRWRRAISMAGSFCDSGRQCACGGVGGVAREDKSARLCRGEPPPRAEAALLEQPRCTAAAHGATGTHVDLISCLMT